MKNIVKIKLVGIAILAILLILVSSVQGEEIDTDFDGIPDVDEIQIYGTSPLRPDTDFDGFDDRMEIFGVSGSGEQLPGYLKSPGDSPLVAAYPKLEFDIDNNFTIFLNKEIAFEHRVAESREYTYGTIITKTVTHSVGVGGSHTTSSYQDITNKSADLSYASSSKNSLSSQKDLYSETTVYGREKTTKYGIRAGGEIDVGIGAKYKPGEGGSVSIGPKAHGEVSASWSRTNIVKDESTAEVERGTYEEVNEQNKKISYRVFEQTTEKGASHSETFSTTNVMTYSTSVSTVNLHTIGSSEEWAEINTQDTSNWGSLRFNFKISNTGTEKATNIHNVRFLIRIGSYAKTFPFLNEPGAVVNDLPPGESVVYPGAVEIPLRLEEIKAIDNGESIEISIIDYDCNEKVQAVSAYNKGVLVQIDDGLSDGKNELTSFLVPVEENWTYLDVLKRLNHTTMSRNTRRKEINLTLSDGNLYSINNLPITNWSWWTARSEGIENKTFLNKKARPGSKVLLTYYQDSDHDFYTDRDEIRTGHNPNDPEDYPSPKLVAVTYSNSSINSPFRSIGLKITNFGDYDAYGIEARMYSLDNTTQVIDEFYGGAVRIKPGETIIVKNEFTYAISTKPVGERNFASSSNGAVSTAAQVNNGIPNDYLYEYSPIVINLSNQYRVNKVKIYIRSVPYRGYVSHSYKIEGSVDGKTWKVIVEDAGVKRDGSFRSEISKEFEPVDVKYVRFNGRYCGYVYDDVYCFKLPIGELELYGNFYEYTDPVIEIMYNDPRGPHQFITTAQISNLSLPINSYFKSMRHEVSLSMLAPESMGLNEEKSIDISYLNPSEEIKDAKLYLSVYSENGTLLGTKNLSTVFRQGLTEKTFTFNPSDYGVEVLGKNLTLVSVATDYQGVMLAEDVSTVKVETPIKITGYVPNLSVSMSEGESKIFIVNTDSERSLKYKWYIDNNLIYESSENYLEFKASKEYLGNHSLKVLVTDGTFNTSLTWNLNIKEVNHAPILNNLDDIYVYENEEVVIAPSASDPDNDTLSFNIISEIPFESSNGIWHWTPKIGDSGDYEVLVVVSDGELSNNQTFFVHVKKLEGASKESESITTGGGGGGESAPPLLTQNQSKTREGKEVEQVNNKDLEDFHEVIIQPAIPLPESNTSTEEIQSQTGLASLGISRLKLSGVALAGLVLAFIYSIFENTKAIGSFKSLS